jgi:predicted transcriptional regulator
MIKTHLTSKEYEIMQVLWNSEKPLLMSEITELSTSVSANSMHPMINHLIDKGLVKVAGNVKVVKVPSRLYEAAISAEDYAALQSSYMFKNLDKKFDIRNFLMCFTKRHKVSDDEVIKELENYIAEYKKENNIKE